jgi:hypothetical protein
MRLGRRRPEAAVSQQVDLEAGVVELAVVAQRVALLSA